MQLRRSPVFRHGFSKSIRSLLVAALLAVLASAGVQSVGSSWSGPRLIVG